MNIATCSYTNKTLKNNLLLCKEKSNLMHNLFIVYFVNLYMFRAYLSPSSGGKPYKAKVKEFRNRPGVAQKVPGGLGSQISMTFRTWRWWGCKPHVPAAFTARKCSWYSLSLGAESTPGPWCDRKKICHWKIQWQHRESIPGPSDK